MNNTWYALDFETSDQNRYSCKLDRVVVAAFNIQTGQVRTRWHFSFRKTCPMCISKLTELMASSHPKVAHNAKFELWLMEKRLGIPIKGDLHDTILMTKHWRNDIPSYDLKSLAWWIFGDTYEPLMKLRQWIVENQGQGTDDTEFDMTTCPDELVKQYCTHDVKMTAMLASRMWKEVKDNYAYQQDARLIREVSTTEGCGITVDTEFYRDFTRRGKRRIRYNYSIALEQIPPEFAGKKPTGKALREHLKLRGETRTTRTGMTKSDDVVLRDHKSSQLVRSVRRIRTDQKTLNTYVANIMAVVDENNRFHPNLVQSDAITRRFRSRGFLGTNGTQTKGNVQNFPRGAGIRSGIVVPPRYGLVKLDLASIEPRLGAHAMSTFIDFDFYCKKYREDPKFNMYLHVIREHTDHGNVTKEDPLYIAYKHGVLGIQYGVGVDTYHKTMVETFELPYTWEQCDAIYKNIRRKCPEFGELQRAVSSIIRAEGKVLDDFGAIYYLPEDQCYKGVNYYCQGCAGNVLKWWWLKVAEYMKDTNDYIFNTVHDELDCAIWKDETSKKRIELYCDVLNELDIFNLPIVAESSGMVNNWGEAG